MTVTSLEAMWLAKLKRVMVMHLERSMADQMSADAIIESLFDIPEVAQAFHLAANRDGRLSPYPSSDEEKLEIVDALNRVADWFDDGSHQDLVDELRVNAAMLHPNRQQ